MAVLLRFRFASLYRLGQRILGSDFMELIITKNGHVYARAHDDTALETDVYGFYAVSDVDVPVYPTSEAGKGKYWELDYADGVLTWVAKDRPLTAEERVQEVEDRLNAMEYPEYVQPAGAHDAYAKGDKVTYNGKRYISLVDGNVWAPEDYPDGWEEVK